VSTAEAQSSANNQEVEAIEPLAKVAKVGICVGCQTKDENKDFLKCGACKTAFYCSTECQKADRKVHKVFSTLFLTF
jgi:hypothetical protein